MTDPIDPETAQRAKTALLELPAPTLDIFIANRVEGMTFAQIAQSRGISVRKVRRHMLRAIRHIARISRNAD